MLTNLFHASEPLFRKKQSELDVQDRAGVICLHWRLGDRTLYSSHYTRIDQIFILWGLLSAVMFVTAQFAPLSWSVQAICWSILTLTGMVAMAAWAWYWAGIERLRWLIWCWLGLVFAGILLTDWGIFACQPLIMSHLCQLWLGLSAAGYGFTGLGVQSRSLYLMAMIHLLAVGVLTYLPDWQFLSTGTIMAMSLFLLGEYQWDMRPPTRFAFLTPEQLQFNQQQQRLRQGEANIVA